MAYHKKQNNQTAASPLVGKLIEKFEFEQMKEGKQTWEKLDNMYQDIANAIITVGHSVNENNRFIYEHIKDDPSFSLQEINVAISALSSDLENISTILRAIYEDHRHLSGEIKEEDTVFSLDVFNRYVLVNDQYRALIFPSILTITEKTMLIADQIRKKKEIQDTSVVTDLEVKA